MNKRVLEVNHATMRFGGLVAVSDLSMHIDSQEIVALIGPNGAGKTTAFNMITGVYTRPRAASRCWGATSPACARIASRTPESLEPSKISDCSRR